MLIVVMDCGRDMHSNRLIDILDDDEKLNNLNKDYHYRQSIVPRLEKLDKNMKKAKGNYDIDDMFYDYQFCDIREEEPVNYYQGA